MELTRSKYTCSDDSCSTNGRNVIIGLMGIKVGHENVEYWLISLSLWSFRAGSTPDGIPLRGDTNANL
jgi:hypothetical protein